MRDSAARVRLATGLQGHGPFATSEGQIGRFPTELEAAVPCSNAEQNFVQRRLPQCGRRTPALLALGGYGVLQPTGGRMSLIGLRLPGWPHCAVILVLGTLLGCTSTNGARGPTSNPPKGHHPTVTVALLPKHGVRVTERRVARERAVLSRRSQATALYQTHFRREGMTLTATIPRPRIPLLRYLLEPGPVGVTRSLGTK